MSYAGTYGPDETCEHDYYRPNCWRCNGTVERYARELPARLAHPDKAVAIEISARTITVFDAHCPSPICGWSRSGMENEADIKQAVDKHLADTRRVARDWAGSAEVKSAAFNRGLL